ncbi:MAG: hypothetical protein M1816_008241 [Peltula sp. TS41687]|nr:MAG: hypothetical protein M1816_008241 [Peltula sp. TS41687]
MQMHHHSLSATTIIDDNESVLLQPKATYSEHVSRRTSAHSIHVPKPIGNVIFAYVQKAVQRIGRPYDQSSSRRFEYRRTRPQFWKEYKSLEGREFPLLVVIRTNYVLIAPQMPGTEQGYWVLRPFSVEKLAHMKAFQICIRRNPKCFTTYEVLREGTHCYLACLQGLSHLSHLDCIPGQSLSADSTYCMIVQILRSLQKLYAAGFCIGKLSRYNIRLCWSKANLTDFRFKLGCSGEKTLKAPELPSGYAREKAIEDLEYLQSLCKDHKDVLVKELSGQLDELIARPEKLMQFKKPQIAGEKVQSAARNLWKLYSLAYFACRGPDWDVMDLDDCIKE